MNENLTEIFSRDGNNNEAIKLQFDKENQLYLNGKKLLTEKKITFRWFESSLLVITALSVLAQAIVSIYQCLAS